MTADEITAFVEGLPGVSTVVADKAGGAPEVAWGDSFFSYEQAKMPFATIVTKDIVNPGDAADAQARDLLAAAHERARRRYRGSSA
jgi:hypothetical protein